MRDRFVLATAVFSIPIAPASARAACEIHAPGDQTLTKSSGDFDFKLPDVGWNQMEVSDDCVLFLASGTRFADTMDVYVGPIAAQAIPKKIGKPGSMGCFCKAKPD